MERALRRRYEGGAGGGRPKYAGLFRARTPARLPSAPLPRTTRLSPTPAPAKFESFTSLAKIIKKKIYGIYKYFWWESALQNC